MRRTRILPQTIAGLDTKLLFLTLLLTVLGLIAVADASAPLAARDFGNQYFFVKQQLVWAGIGLVGLFIVSKIPYTFWRKVAGFLFSISFITFLLPFYSCNCTPLFFVQP